MLQKGRAKHGATGEAVTTGKNQPAAARKWNTPFPVSPLRGKAGAGGFPPRRDTCRASQQRWRVPCGDSPRKRDFKALR